MKNYILAILPSREVRLFKSTSTLARQLSGNGTTSVQRTIQRRLELGGGYVGNVYVQRTAFEG